MDILDHLPALRVFEAVARLGSVRLAAAELGVTEGAVSKQIKALESLLNTELFIRGHRKLVLTQAAERLASNLTGAFETVVRSAEQMERISRKGYLVIAAPATFLVCWFLPRLPDLQKRVRGTEINVVTWNKDLTVSDRSIDIHVVVGNVAEAPGMVSHVVGAETFGPVAHPSLVHSQMSAVEFLALPRLATTWPTALWRNWSTESGHSLPDAEVIVFERLLFAVRAAEAGMGTVLAPGPSVWDALAEKKLLAPLGLYRREGHWGLSWRTDQTSAVHMSVLRWFQAEFATSAARAGLE